MKKPKLLLLLLSLYSTSVNAAIVNNSTSTATSEDSVSFLFCSLDSLGNPVTADSVLILTTGPSGAVVYKDSIAISDSRILSTTIKARQFYTFKEQVSNIDGVGSEGRYGITLLALNSNLSLATTNNYDFQIISTELSDRLAFLDAPVSSLSSGSGAYAYTLVTYDSANAQVIPSVGLAVRNLDQSALIAVGSSNTNGRATFNLDAASYHVVPTAPGYIFTLTDTFTVAGPGVDSVFGFQFNPGVPSSPVFCRVFGFLFTADGKAESGATVKAGLPSGVARWSNVIISPFDVATTTDSSGYFYLDLVPSDSLTPSGSQYEISIFRSNGSILRKRFSIPAQPSWRLEW